jgi:hypothetical protein
MTRSFTNRGRFRGTTERLVTALGILFTGLKDVSKRATIFGSTSVPKQLDRQLWEPQARG